MASAKILIRIPVNSTTRKVSYWGMPKGIKIVGIYKQLLSIVH